MNNKSLTILGIRGIPAAHGGFETFAEYLAIFLKTKGWSVTVYCQEDEGDKYESDWNGIKLIHIPVSQKGALGTIIFDLKSVIHSLKNDDLLLTLGYNTAIFNFLHVIAGRKNIINMDGIEWRRDKWGAIAKTWFWINERLGCWFGTHLVADHPKILEHLSTRVNSDKITMIPYGANCVANPDLAVLTKFNLKENNYFIVIARAEPENSLLEIVSAFSNKKRNANLVVLGNYSPETNSFHKSVIDAASDEVKFVGAIYDQSVVASLRYFSTAYIHGHRVGGTNPSLVESLGAGNAIIAHDNHFNRWVASDASVYFSDVATCEACMESLLADDNLCSKLKENAIIQHNNGFTWNDILAQYEKLLLKFC